MWYCKSQQSLVKEVILKIGVKLKQKYEISGQTIKIRDKYRTFPNTLIPLISYTFYFCAAHQKEKIFTSISESSVWLDNKNIHISMGNKVRKRTYLPEQKLKQLCQHAKPCGVMVWRPN